MQADFYIKPVAFAEIIDKFAKIASEEFSDDAVTRFSIQSHFSSESINTSGKKGKETPIAAAPFIKKYKDRPHIEAVNVCISFSPNLTATYLAEDTSDSQPLGPRVRVNSNSGGDRELGLADGIARHFCVVPVALLGSSRLSDTQLSSLHYAEKVIAALATETAKISTATTSSFEAFVQGVKQRSLELEDEYQRKSNELDHRFLEKANTLEAEHKTKLDEIAIREKAHVDAVTKFELRNNTAVRRDLLKEIRLKIEEQKSIQISAGTTHKRRIIHVVCAATLLTAISCIAFFASKFGTGVLDWKLLVPLGTWTGIFVTTAIYYIRWNDQWFRDHARVEFETRKFSADILRASWIAELFFEWTEKKGVAMPQDLIGSFTKNLFESVGGDGKHHPIDQVNDLIRECSSLELSKSGVKVVRKE